MFASYWWVWEHSWAVAYIPLVHWTSVNAIYFWFSQTQLSLYELVPTQQAFFFFLKMLQLYVVVAAHWSPGSSSTKAAKCFCPQIQWRLKPFTKTFEDSVDRWTPNMPWTWKFTHSWAQVKLISTYSLWSLTYSTFLLLDGFQGRTVSYGRRFFHFNLWLKCHNLLLLGYTSKSKNKCVVTYGTNQENEFSKMFVIFSWNLNQARKLTTKSSECTLEYH